HTIDVALPNDFRLCADAMAKGLSVVEHAPDAPLSRAYLELAARFGGAPPEPLEPARRGFSLRTLLGRS
ncbi:MAG: hypothetical protein ACXWZS_09240, partial [Gemmatirosa sp.]